MERDIILEKKMGTPSKYQPWRYSRQQVQWYSNEEKCPVPEASSWKHIKDDVSMRKWELGLKEGFSPVKLSYYVRGKAAVKDSYASALILDGHRIKGIDYTPVKNRCMYGSKVREVGWHENTEYFDDRLGCIVNDHDYAMECDPFDLEGFHFLSCEKWHIDTGERERGLFS